MEQEEHQSVIGPCAAPSFFFLLFHSFPELLHCSAGSHSLLVQEKRVSLLFSAIINLSMNSTPMYRHSMLSEGRLSIHFVLAAA